jgi:AcrR family transcriptional regulator
VKKKALDRRTERTDALLREALVGLLSKKRYDAITVQEILNSADVGRSTFYSRYYDKEDLLVSNWEWLFESLSPPFDPQQSVGAQLLPSQDLFRHVYIHRPLYEALVGARRADKLFGQGQAALSRVIMARLDEALRERRPAPSLPLPIVANYLAGTFMVLLRWWLDNQIPLTPERMHEIFQELALPGLHQVLEKA